MGTLTMERFKLPFMYRVSRQMVGSYGAGILLTIIDKCPLGMDNMLALKRVIIVAFPASMSAAVSDSIK